MIARDQVAASDGGFVEPFRKECSLAENISLLVCGRMAVYAGGTVSLETH